MSAGAAEAQVITEFSAGISTRSFPYSITAGPDGNLWFTETSSSQIGRITPSGIVTEFGAGISIDAQPSGITAGPDGNLWFAEFNNRVIGRIGRMTPSGAVTEFSAGITPGVGPWGIAAGPDGNLWFTEFGGGIGRITSLGVITEFRVGITAGSQPFGITAGPDGNMWFTEGGDGDPPYQGNRIGRITPSGVITEFNTGIRLFQLSGITTGPDGNMWFVENSSYCCEIPGRIGRITPSGVVTEFSAGITFGHGPGGIVAGPDGNLWFTENHLVWNRPQSDGRIGRITPGGVVTEFVAGISAGEALFNITAGSDGNLWFTEIGGTAGRIGRISGICNIDGTTMCLGGGRFRVQAHWTTSDGSSGDGQAASLTSDTGYFWFFNSSNVELIVKVLDGCDITGSKWVFAGGLTNVNVALTVTDTQTGTAQTYINPQNTPFQPIQDTSTFSTCP